LKISLTKLITKKAGAIPAFLFFNTPFSNTFLKTHQNNQISLTQNPI